MPYEEGINDQATTVRATEVYRTQTGRDRQTTAVLNEFLTAVEDKNHLLALRILLANFEMFSARLLQPGLARIGIEVRCLLNKGGW